MRILRTITTLFLLLVFTVATTGVVVASHYCAGELDNVSLVVEKPCSCSVEQTEQEGEPCCTQIVSFLKVKTDTPSISASIQVPIVVLCTLVRDNGIAPALSALPSIAQAVVTPSPPRRVDIPIYCCTLLI